MVSIITCTIRDEFIDNVFQNYERQQLEQKELIIVLNKDSMDINKWYEKAENYQNVRVYQVAESSTLGDCLNFGVARSNYDYVAKFDDDDYYGPQYLVEALLGFLNEDVSIVGKSSFYMYLKNKQALVLVDQNQNDYTEWIAGPTFVIKKEIFRNVHFRKLTGPEDYFFIQDSLAKGYKIYSSSKNNFTLVRRNHSEHTWQMDDDSLLQWGEVVKNTDDFTSIVNN